MSEALRQAEALLRRIGETPSAPSDIAEAALALAVLESGATAPERYRRHLQILGRDLAEIADGATRVADRVAALGATLVERFGYRGDAEGYDDLQNANLMHVIDRRKGLPVALGILFIHAARSQGWPAAGLAFPGHFLIRVDGDDGRAIVDPFHEGRTPDAGTLRRLLQATAGETAELSAQHYALVTDRDVLLRLQNNIKLRLIGQDRLREAGFALDRMLLMAPEDAGMWQECALIQAELGVFDRAQEAIDRVLALPIGDAARHRMAALRQRLRGSLH